MKRKIHDHELPPHERPIIVYEVRDSGMFVYKDRELVAVIPREWFPHIIFDLAKVLRDR